MAKIRTVLGDIAPEDAGITLTHEHILYANPGVEFDRKAAFDFDTVADEVAATIPAGMADYRRRRVHLRHRPERVRQIDDVQHPRRPGAPRHR